MSCHGLQAMAEEGWSWFLGRSRARSQDPGLYACRLTQRQVGLLPGPLHVGMNPAAPTKALVASVDGCQTVVGLGPEDTSRDVLLGRDADITSPH